jgi:hypothetical protein
LKFCVVLGHVSEDAVMIYGFGWKPCETWQFHMMYTPNQAKSGSIYKISLDFGHNKATGLSGPLFTAQLNLQTANHKAKYLFHKKTIFKECQTWPGPQCKT